MIRKDKRRVKNTEEGNKDELKQVMTTPSDNDSSYYKPTVCFLTITMVKVRLFCWWCCVCCIVLLTLCIIILRARHDHNKIVPCEMIKVFFFKLN